MFLNAPDTISGKEARAQIKLNGKLEDLFYARKVEAKFEKNKTPIKVIGKRNEQSKTTGWKGTGSLNIYYVTSIFRELAIEYIKNGKDTYFDLLLTTEDPASETGTQTTMLYNCNLDGTILAKIDIESDALDEDMDFTFDDADLLVSFTKLV